MVAQNGVVTRPAYSEEDHGTWAALIERQTALIEGRACKEFMVGWPKLALDPHRLPDPDEVSERIYAMTGWTLGNAQNEYLGPTEWFEHILECRFPVTNYIRRPHEIEFTPLPDLFHEYYGHLAFFTDQRFADAAQLFGAVYMSTDDERHHQEIARLWWFSIEFGLIREDGELKVYGAGLLSSPGELLHSLKPETPRVPFDIRQVAETPSSAYAYHDKYFVLEDSDHIRRLIQDYARMEGLPVPQPLHG